MKGAPYWATETELLIMQTEVKYYVTQNRTLVLDLGALERLSWDELSALHFKLVMRPA